MEKKLFIILLLCLSQTIFADCDDEEEKEDPVTLPTIKVVAQPEPSNNWNWGNFGQWSGGGVLGGLGGSGSGSNGGERDAPERTCNPIVISSGKKIQQELDFQALGEMPLTFLRYYDSFASGNANFGVNGKWRHNFDYRFATNAQGQYIRQLPDGNNYIIKNPTTATLVNGIWVVKLPTGDIENYDSAGKLISKKNIHGIGWILTYTNDKLSKVTHTNGNTIQLLWSGDQITQVTDPNGNVFKYSYNLNKLTAVTYPNGTGSRTYHYGENGAGSDVISGISLNGKRYNTYFYNAGKAIKSGRADGSQVDNIEYGLNYSLVTNVMGAKYKYIYESVDKTRLLKVERSNISNVPNSSLEIKYDANGFIVSKKNWSGQETLYVNDSYGRIIEEKTNTTEGQNIKQYKWKSDVSLMMEVRTNNKVTTYQYYTDSNFSNNRIKSITTCDINGQICSVIGFGYAYHANGLVKEMVTSERGILYTYTYDEKGNLIQTKNEKGLIVSYSLYNNLGQPGKVINENGMATEYIYDERGRIKQVKDPVKNSLKKYSYNEFGLTQIDDNGVFTNISYGDNGTIIAVSDGSISKVESQKIIENNLLGLPISMIYKDSQGTIRYTSSKQYNEIGSLVSRTGANNQKIKYQYDMNGNLKSFTDELGGVVNYSYDSSRNMIQEVRTNGAIISNEYDNDGRILRISGPKINFLYSYNENGHLASDFNTDKGDVQYTYDGDNLFTTNIPWTTHYHSYDPLGRKWETQAGASIQRWRYDSCTNGKGKICGTFDGMKNVDYTAPDNVAKTQSYFGYTPDGKLNYQKRIIDGVTFTTEWKYDVKGNIVEENQGNSSYIVSYTYNSLNKVDSINLKIGQNTYKVLSNILYEPYGKSKEYTYGNGINRSVIFDKDYQISSINSSGVQNINYSYDAKGNILSKVDSLNGWNRSYSYNKMGEILTETGSGVNDAYTYDLNYNRISKNSTSTGLVDYILGGGNRLIKTSGSEVRDLKYDDIGNLIEKKGFGGNYSYGYDAFGRLSTLNNGVTNFQYEYDANNLRSQKKSNMGSVDYIYSPDGRLMAETKLSALQDGSLSKIYIYLEGAVVAFVSNNSIYYVHNDNLGRPEIITDSNKVVVWKSNNNSFSRNVVVDLIGGFNVGSPGQYYDIESKIWYNWNRYYDPEIGRYIQSDPVGVLGGLNTYAYVGNNPINFYDVKGFAQFGTRNLSGVPFQFSNSFTNEHNIDVLHEQLWFDDVPEDNVGFFGNTLCGSDNGDVRSDKDAKRKDYKLTGPKYDDKIMRQALNNIKNQWNKTDYCVAGRNCQSFSDALRDEYNNIGNNFFNNLPARN